MGDDDPGIFCDRGFDQDAPQRRATVAQRPARCLEDDGVSGKGDRAQFGQHVLPEQRYLEAIFHDRCVDIFEAVTTHRHMA